MDTLRELGALALGSRFRRISDQLMQDGILIYRDAALKHQGTLNFEPKWFPIVTFLKKSGPTAVMDIARSLGISHPSVNQLAKELTAAGLIASYKDTQDKRKRVLALTTAGKSKLIELEPIWRNIERALQQLVEETQSDLMQHLNKLEDALANRSFRQRYADTEQQQQNNIEIIRFSPEYTDDFYRLNEDWISEYFTLEPADMKTLSDPQARVIDTGGEIIFAIDQDTGQVLGTCALVRQDDARCEMAKMAVAKEARGRGIGQLLGEGIVAVARDMGFMVLYLETNAKLVPAQGLYRKLGFQNKPFPYQSDYSRANVYMELIL